MRRQLRHIVRYLFGTTAIGIIFPKPNRGLGLKLDKYVDANWAVCEGNKSTSGGVAILGGCQLMSWSRGQTVVAISSCESEFHAIILGADEVLGLKSWLSDCGLDLKAAIYSCSSSGRSHCFR